MSELPMENRHQVFVCISLITTDEGERLLVSRQLSKQWTPSFGSASVEQTGSSELRINTLSEGWGAYLGTLYKDTRSASDPLSPVPGPDLTVHTYTSNAPSL